MIRELQSLTYGRKGWERVGVRAASQTSQRGQSLVETVLITPLLLLMFLGVLEVGWALRGYLVLLNANREATRFAARGIYLDFSQPDINDVGYERVLQHAIDSVSDQLALEFFDEPKNATMFITHMEIDSGYPCSEEDRPCDDECQANPDTSYPDDEIRLPPPEDGDSYENPFGVTLVVSDTFRARYGIGPDGDAPITHTTRIPDTLWQALRIQNEKLNCEKMAKDPDVTPSANSVIIVEIFYDQPQLLGVPIVSNRFTDPVPLYTNTMMRIAETRQR